MGTPVELHFRVLQAALVDCLGFVLCRSLGRDHDSSQWASTFALRKTSSIRKALCAKPTNPSCIQRVLRGLVAHHASHPFLPVVSENGTMGNHLSPLPYQVFRRDHFVLLHWATMASQRASRSLFLFSRCCPSTTSPLQLHTNHALLCHLLHSSNTHCRLQ